MKQTAAVLLTSLLLGSCAAGGGTPAPGSKFAGLHPGLSRAEVEALIGPADAHDTHLTGKSFIPFWMGGDTSRRDEYYRGAGTLTFSAQEFSGEPDTLVAVAADPAETGLHR